MVLEKFKYIFIDDLPKENELDSFRKRIVYLLLGFLSAIYLTYGILYCFWQPETRIVGYVYLSTQVLFLLIAYLLSKDKWVAMITVFTILCCFLSTYSTIALGRGTYANLILLIYTISIFVLDLSKARPLFYITIVFISYFFTEYYISIYGISLAEHRLKFEPFVNTMLGIIALGIFSKVYLNTLLGSMKKTKIANTILKQANEDLVIQNTTIENQKAELELFTFMASHDLKSPIRTINSYLGLVKKNLATKDEEKLHGYINYAQKGATKLNLLVKGLSEFNRVLTPSNAVVPTSLPDTVESVRNVLNLENRPDVKLVNRTLSSIKIDKTHLLHLLQNLIQNGLKYNQSEAKQIELLEVINQDRVQILIQDNGIGIDEQYFETIFKPFEKLHSNSEYEGTGIGLTICKKIVSQYDGKIFAKSNPKGGSTFFVEFPIQMLVTDDSPNTEHSMGHKKTSGNSNNIEPYEQYSIA